MKARRLILPLAICSIFAFAVSCDSDDENDAQPSTQSEGSEDRDADEGNNDSTQIHPDSLRLIDGGFTAKEREYTTGVLNQLRKQGCECTMDGKTEFLQTDVVLKWDKRLEVATLRHTKDMAKHMILGHGGTDGSNFRDRMTDAGYPVGVAGENVAFGQADVFAVVHEGWKLSDQGHCNNMLNEEFDRYALSLRKDTQGRPYWTLLLAKGLD